MHIKAPSPKGSSHTTPGDKPGGGTAGRGPAPSSIKVYGLGPGAHAVVVVLVAALSSTSAFTTRPASTDEGDKSRPCLRFRTPEGVDDSGHRVLVEDGVNEEGADEDGDAAGERVDRVPLRQQG